MPTFVDVFGIIALVSILSYLLYIIYYALDLFLQNPFLTYKKLTPQEERVVAKNIPAYSKLSLEQKNKLRKRVSRFRARKEFIFHGDIPDKEEIKVLLSATAAFLTLGFKNYNIKTIERIIIYPTKYYSRLNKQNHLGEYNPNLKTLVFSAEHILKGFEDLTDNKNLGVHEFAHALIFNAMDNYTITARTFMGGLNRMQKLLKHPKFIERIDKTQYFRDYGKTNIHEFFAVALENYTETPSDFIKEFPELYKIITRMLNFRQYRFH